VNVLTGQTLQGLKREFYCATEPCRFHCRHRGPTMMHVDSWWCWHTGTDCICNLLPGHAAPCVCFRCGYTFPRDMSKADMLEGLAKSMAMESARA
jgi:hypothetical protein